MRNNINITDIIHINNNEDDIVVQINHVHYNGNIDFTISSVKQSTIETFTSKSLIDAFDDVSNKVQQLSDNHISISDIIHSVKSLYHNYMKEVLRKITEMKVMFTGGTLYDYQ